MIIGTLGIKACGPAASVSSKEMREEPPRIEVENISVDRDGIKIAGEDGVSVTGPDGKVWRSNREVKVGLEKDKKRFPLAMLVWALYGGLLVWRFGATPGKKITGIKITDNKTGGRVPADKAFLRAFFSLASLFLMLGYIWAAWQKDGLTWHDMIAGTKAVKV